MSELLAGFGIIVSFGIIFYFLARKLDIFNSDHSDEDFSCH